jgi:hypothetical protein
MINDTEEMIVDTENTVKYKVVNSEGTQLSVEDSRNLAEMFINGLPPELKEDCKIVPITEDNKQVLFG